MREKIITFRIGEIKIADDGSNSLAIKASKNLSELLKNLEYEGTLRKSNSNQLDIHFDEALLKKLKMQGWPYSENPKIDLSALGENWGNQRSDFITTPINMENHCIVVEIEKANKKTIWFDFIKLWMFIEAKQAKAGILLCPLNYSHKHGIWNLFDEACNYKKYLGRFAGVPEEKLDLISIIGYEQMIYMDNKFIVWNATQFNKIKRSS